MHKIFSFVLPFLLTSVLLTACLVADSSYKSIAPGVWRGVLRLEPITYPVYKKDTVFNLPEDFREGELPFNFEVKYTDDEHFTIEIINGDERILCDSIAFGHNKFTARDTMVVFFPEYQSYLKADIRGPNMQGEWVVTTKDNYRIPFFARAGKDFRFTHAKEKPQVDLNGAWASWFGSETESPEKAIGEFKQEGNRLTGTFRTETGDYRFLEGTVQGNKFWLSCFDGAHAFLFSGLAQGDSLLGEFKSGTHYRTLWTAKKDPGFQLADPDQISTVGPSAGGVQFKLSTPEGKTLAFPSADFDGKVKIFTIMGTWCPNCLDEIKFIREYLQTHSGQSAQIQVVGFAFERDTSIVRANAHLSAYKNRLGIPFDLVYAGKANAEAAHAVFPALNKVSAFPTMIILDKQNKIRRIHTGFDGPATSKYAFFKADFEKLMNTLILE